MHLPQTPRDALSTRRRGQRLLTKIAALRVSTRMHVGRSRGRWAEEHDESRGKGRRRAAQNRVMFTFAVLGQARNTPPIPKGAIGRKGFSVTSSLLHHNGPPLTDLGR